jgi:hypothetical protein
MMKRIGQASGIPISVPSDAYLSFFNSPYTGHRNHSAVDIYPAHQEWGGEGYAPVDGEVIQIKQIKMGRRKSFETSELDYAIGIRPYDESSKIVRMLHCRPTVKVGDDVSTGDSIGSLIRSRYFNFWTGPHYHVEIMHLKDFRRSTQSLPLVYSKELQGAVTFHGKISPFEADLTINYVSDDFVLIHSNNLLTGSLGGYWGHVGVTSEGERGLLDAGIPHYSYGGMHGVACRPGLAVSVGGVEIGASIVSQGSAFFFRQNHIARFSLNHIHVRGVSTYLYSKKQLVRGKPLLKVIPAEYASFTTEFTEGEVVTLSVD